MHSQVYHSLDTLALTAVCKIKFVPSWWHSCANALAKLCQFDGKVVPSRWHKSILSTAENLC